MRVVANLAALAALACVLAYWGWRWLGPAPEPLVHKPVDDVAAALAVAPPFGVGSSAPVAGAAPAPSSGEPRLLGVLAEPGGSGRALFRMPDGTARLAWAGEALGELGTLAAVHVDGVTLRGATGERTLPLRWERTPAGTPPPLAGPACVPPGYKGSVVRLNAELVAGLIQQPGSLAAVAEPKEGALVVLDESGFGGMLGLRKGDRIAQANGIALRSTDDIVLAVLRPLAASQTVRVVGQRGGAPREFVIVNASACTR